MMEITLHQYLSQLRQILTQGSIRPDRTGVGTLSLFGLQARYSLAEGFPLVTTKRVFWRAVVGELLWMLEGTTNRDRLEQITYGTVGTHSTIWDEWADDIGSLGPIYGDQWRAWETRDGEIVDQIADVIAHIRSYPYSRRHVVSAWNVADLPVDGLSPRKNAEIGRMALAPCHCLFQFYVDDRRRLSCQLYQRSGDMFLGVPFNIASYALLTHMVAHVTGLHVGDLIHVVGDAHVYQNHIDQAFEQLQRQPRRLPNLRFARRTDDIFSLTMDDIILEGYDPHPAIKAEVAV